jgi:hypothetical protein
MFAGLFIFVMWKLRNQYQDCVAVVNHVEERLRQFKMRSMGSEEAAAVHA